MCTWGGTYTDAQRRFFFDPEGQMMLRLAADDMLERADFTVIPRGDLLPSAVSEWGIGSLGLVLVVATLLALVPAQRALRLEALVGAGRH